MRNILALKFFVIISISMTFTACSDYISDTKSVTQNGKIGLPCGVNLLNKDISVPLKSGRVEN